MAEVKNSFLQSKMNKDLDDRLIPNGEYRDALNISVGKAEDKDVGALEAVLGNDLAADTGNNNLVCIGQVADNQNNRIFQFWTDYTDVSNTLIPPVSADMRITVYDLNSSPPLKTLVSGSFLNFATNPQYRILGANVLENLLFWTDNRNQPRKINISSAITNPSYYTDEVQISVAKYAPVLPMNVYLDIPVTTTSASSNPTTQSVSFTVSATDFALLHVGMQLITNLSTPALTLNNYAVITQLTNVGAVYTVIVSVPVATTIPLGSVLHFYGTSMTDKADEQNWPGDPNYLKDKYVRFSYRYKFDDGEYSLMAPFTQIMFIPNQNGYFLSGDEDAAYRSTIVSWMENFINNIELHVELPDTGNNIENSYKIKSIDILYKESDALAIKVLETVSVNEIKLQSGFTNYYTYTYKSQKPYKTLPESQTVRVYDKVPVRARAQEIVGNRVVYGNFISKSTPPAAIDYNLAVTKKTDSFTSWAEYPNHTLKQNRNYQAGIVLSDKFGRQSTVILSSNDIGKTAAGINLVGSTLYSPYYVQSSNLNVKEWRGNTLAMIINSPIVSSINEGNGTPGLYAIVSGSNGQTGNGFQITSSPNFNQLVIPPTGSDFYIYTFTLAAIPAQRNLPIAGTYLRGFYTDYVKVTGFSGPDGGGLYTVVTDFPINNIYKYTGTNTPPDIKYAYDLNQPGWYSYKIVVRQQQQEYYNVYLPGFLNGYPMFQTTSHSGSVGTNPTIFPSNEVNKTAHTVLLNDNINKIPRDLTEVGPDQKQYRSSVELFGRVENLLEATITSNKQYYPAKKADVASTIASSSDLNFLVTNDPDNIDGTASNNFYQLSTTPIIARISTVNKIGVIASDLLAAAPPNVLQTMNPFLGVYETAPVVSLLDIFWETSSSGLISDLNADVLTGSDIAIGFDNLIFEHNEFQEPSGILGPLDYGDQDSPYITGYFSPINSLGLPINVNSMSMTVVDLTGANRSSDFELIRVPLLPPTPESGKFAIKIKNPFVFLINSTQKESYIFTFNIIDTTNGNATLTAVNSLNNSLPVISYPTYQDPVEVFYINDLIVGPIISCAGINGAPTIPADLTFNKQQLQWSVYSVTPDFLTYFSIDPITGVISLNDITVPVGIDFDVAIRLTDAYNFATSTPGTGSLYAERNIIINVPASADFCSEWISGVFTGPGPEFDYGNFIRGKFNFWRMFGPGETIDVANSSVEIFGYTAVGGAFYFPPAGQNQLVFSSSNFDGTFAFTASQGPVDSNPAFQLELSGSISVLPSGRTIPIDLQSEATLTSTFTSRSQTCNIAPNFYLPPVPPSTNNKKWKLTNDNLTTSIRWQALTSSAGAVIGGILTPGNFVGSTFYGGTYTCIRDNSLSYGAGGTVIIDNC